MLCMLGSQVWVENIMGIQTNMTPSCWLLENVMDGRTEKLSEQKRDTIKHHHTYGELFSKLGLSKEYF